MARIRTVKPEFFRNYKLFQAEQEESLPLRLAFEGLWTAADREGRFKWIPETLKLDCLPYDNVNFSDVLNALFKHEYIIKYEVSGENFGYIPGFLTHQCINIREAKSILPAPDEKAIIETHVHTPENYITSYGANVLPEIRQFIFERDGFKCVRCNSKTDLTIDHIFPKSMGGTHAIKNLRTLCGSCNSARPVAGEALIKDLEKDGLTLDDMTVICVHVHTPVYTCGKGREGERNGKEEAPEKNPPPVIEENFIPDVKPKKEKKEKPARGAPEKSPEFEIIYPFTSEGFLAAWDIWKKYKSQQFKFVYKPIGEQGALKDLGELSDGDEARAVRLINNAISKGWKGIYDLTNYEKNKRNNGTGATSAELAEVIAKHRATDYPGGSINLSGGIIDPENDNGS